MRPTSLTIITAIFTTLSLASELHAQSDISGSIGFGSLGASVGGGDLGTASSFTVDSPFIASETGVYSGVPLATTVTFTGFTFNPPVASVTPLWTFNVGAITYSFDATSVTSFFESGLDEWNIGGNGVAMITGYNSTPGTWNLNLSQSGDSIVFDSTSAVSPVPEPSTLVLLGGGLAGMVKLARKRK